MQKVDRLKSISEIMETIKSPDCISTVFDDFSNVYGIKNVAYLGLALHKLTRDEPHIIVTYDNDWINRYIEQDYIKVDPVLHQSIRSILPSDWRDFSKEDEKVRVMFDEARQFGVGNQGLTIPVRGSDGELALFSVTTEESDESWDSRKQEYISEFQMLAYYFHEMVLRTNDIRHKKVHLAPREVEVLKWVANGKTAVDVAAILNLSEHTVRHYIENARYRLGALNQTHAVARAIARNLISVPD